MAVIQHPGSLLITALSCCFALAGLAPLQRCPAGPGVHLGMLLPQARLVVFACSSTEVLLVYVALTRIEHTNDWPLVECCACHTACCNRAACHLGNTQQLLTVCCGRLT